MILWRKTPSEMANAPLDEYRLMMGTQLWLKTAIIDFIATLFGVDEKASGTNTNNSSLDSVFKELDSVSHTHSYSRKSKIDKERLIKEYKEEKAKEKAETEKLGDKQEPVDLSKINVTNWNPLVNDNSQRRDGKVNALTEKLKRYKSQGYIK